MVIHVFVTKKAKKKKKFQRAMHLFFFFFFTGNIHWLERIRI